MKWKITEYIESKAIIIEENQVTITILTFLIMFILIGIELFN